MHTTNSELRMTRRFDATPERVLDAWVDPALAVRWLFATAMRPLAHAAIDARVGGGYILIDRDSGPGTRRFGTYLRLDRPSHLAFTMTTDDRTDAATSVCVGIEPMRCGCALTLTHAGVPRGELRMLQARWLGILYGLAETLDLLRPDTNADEPARAAPAAAATAITSASAGYWPAPWETTPRTRGGAGTWRIGTGDSRGAVDSGVRGSSWVYSAGRSIRSGPRSRPGS